MGGYIGSSVGNLANAAERKQTYSITTATTSLTGLAYTPTKVHVFHNGVRLVDGTDYTATNGTSITLTNSAQNGDEVVVISYPSFQTSDTVSAANGGTFAGNVDFSGDVEISGTLTTTGRPAFKAYRGGNAWQSFGGTSYAKLTFNSTDHNVGSHYDTTNYKFVAPVAGVYMFGAQFRHDANAEATVKIEVNATTAHAICENSTQGDMTQTSTTINLAANDYVEAFGKVGNTNADDWFASLQESFFYGFLIG